eukprot:COSAG01_NODE_267_length_19843_cov_17.620948_2_plen_77_part_00
MAGGGVIGVCGLLWGQELSFGCGGHDGRVVFVPRNSATTGLYDPSPSAARGKPAYTLSQTLPPLWNVALLPYYNKL